MGWFNTIGKFSVLREYVLRMDLMHSGNLIILCTMSGCIPPYGVHCPSRNTPQKDFRKPGDWIWGDLVAHSIFWEGPTNWVHLLICIWHYLVASDHKWKISQIVVTFSEYLNFNKNKISNLKFEIQHKLEYDPKVFWGIFMTPI